ncbi:hypothetical protein UNSWDHB_393 [Dehalobacter sp. UNSWDHB]|jgi:hypothetical protein|uniref:DUF4367 domain-containing protein n=1 Tax=unclassified Dehalobacter TaxID=2635733 RepID=UPI00028BBB92|nr:MULTISPECIES: DUF4367 domain-containing protein [unclassified Dehalobacter]AFV01536.1 hypothetical protein DHBDCA_p508 [Dehalobacter sp. DCA]AFV04571.1 hypothetical protein DCF50_p565 [Dehalobacter sp. CF]EQB22276.1 hypothetical protein UNSWDHB_393 [Dehalobacter sp. UNSWDHB]
MLNNSSQSMQKKLYEEYEDSLFRLVMYETVEKEGKVLLEEREKLKYDPAFVPSEEAVQKFSSQLDNILKRKKAYALRQKTFRILNRSAVAMLIVIILLFTTVASVQAIRVKVLNFFMDIQPKYTSYQVNESGNGSGNGGAVVNWTKAYVPTYIPEGYKVNNSSNSETFKKIVFRNQQDMVILYTELNEGSIVQSDTENASVFKEISINGHKGTLTVKNSTVTIVWEIKGRIFTVSASTDQDTALKIAEGVKYIN